MCDKSWDVTVERYNPPPNWPSPPPDWRPPEGWKPDPAWPPPPPDWEFWVDDSPAAASPVPHEAAASHASPDMAPEQLSEEHLGRRASIKWDDDRRYTIGTISGIAADASEITVRLDSGTSVSFVREQTPRGPTNPLLYVWD